jgi:hypothetical protein
MGSSSALLRQHVRLCFLLNLKIEVHAQARERGETQILVKRDVPFPNSAPARETLFLSQIWSSNLSVREC